MFSPQGGPAPYWAETGFVGEPGTGAELPTRDTAWTSDSDRLTVEKPVTLTYDDGAGLVFRRTIAVDDKFMFTIKDAVENNGAEPVTLHPYALILRRGKPDVSGYAVLHEGLVGVIGDSSRAGNHLRRYRKGDRQRTRALKGDGRLARLHRQILGLGDHPRSDGADRSALLGERRGAAEDYQTDFLGDARVIAPGASSEVVSHVFAGAKEVAHDRRLRSQSRHQEVRSDDRLGLVLFHHQAVVPTDRHHLPGSSAISASRSLSSPCSSRSPSSRSPIAATPRWRR